MSPRASSAPRLQLPMKPRFVALRSKRTPVTSRKLDVDRLGRRVVHDDHLEGAARVRVDALEARERDERVAVHRHDDRHARLRRPSRTRADGSRSRPRTRRPAARRSAACAQASARPGGRARAALRCAGSWRRAPPAASPGAARRGWRARAPACASRGARRRAAAPSSARCASPRARARAAAPARPRSRDGPYAPASRPPASASSTIARCDSSRSAASCSRSPCALSRTRAVFLELRVDDLDPALQLRARLGVAAFDRRAEERRQRQRRGLDLAFRRGTSARTSSGGSCVRAGTAAPCARRARGTARDSAPGPS